jgi:hypothetical protein
LALVFNAQRVLHHKLLELLTIYGYLPATPARGGLGSLCIRMLAKEVAPFHGMNTKEKIALKVPNHGLMA